MTDIEIRPVAPSDAEDLTALMNFQEVCVGTTGLPSREVSRMRERLERSSDRDHRLVAVMGGVVIGFVFLRQGANPRYAHAGYLGISVHPEYWGQGVGTSLMVAIIELADRWLNLKRIELDVNTDNESAIALYKKLGFEIEGTKRLSLFSDGKFKDCYFMARLRP